MSISLKITGFMSQASWIRKMFEEGDNLKKKYGADKVYDLSLGNPNLAPPEIFGKILKQVVNADITNKHGYMPNAGYAEVRQSVADYLSVVHGCSLNQNHVIMTCGAGGALNVILKTLLDKDDEVIVPMPYFVEYRFYVDNAGGIIKQVKAQSDFNLDLEAVSNAITDKTKVILINSPNNPTGKVYNSKLINGLSELLATKSRERGKAIYLVSDEPYRDIVYDGIEVPSILAAYNNSIIASSYSKSLSLPGERIGYLAVNPNIDDVEMIIDGAILCNRILGFVNAPALMQRVVALLQGTHVSVEIYKRKRDLLCDALSSLGYRFSKPEGAFYLFVKSPIDDDIAFVNALLKERIITVPGSGFSGPGHFRIAYCVDDLTIVNAMKGFETTLKRFS